MAKLYANENAQLVLVARRAAPLNAVADACRQLGAKDVVTVEADVSVEEDLRRIVKTAGKVERTESTHMTLKLDSESKLQCTKL